jgi:hypothetical protein
MNHEKTSIGELDAENFQRDTAGVGPEKDDEIRPAWVRRIERAWTVLHDEARPLLGDPVSSG